jgi:uncharacterized cupredoxin-like copper-binding protein
MTIKTTRTPMNAGIVVALFGLLVAACSGGAAAKTTTSSASTAPTAAVVTNATAPASPASAASPLTSASPAPTSIASATHDPAAHAASPTTTEVAVVSATPAPTAPPVVTLAPTSQPQSGPVAVTLNDVAIKLDRSSAQAGAVTFAIKNAGTVIHQLVVLKTDVPQNQIPADPSKPGLVAQPGFVTQTQIINPGGTATLTLTLGSGKYVLLCNQAAHYLVGMHIGFTIN